MLRKAACRARRPASSAAAGTSTIAPAGGAGRPSFSACAPSIAVARDDFVAAGDERKEDAQAPARPCPDQRPKLPLEQFGSDEPEAQPSHPETLAWLHLEQLRQTHLLRRDVERADRHLAVTGAFEHRTIRLDLRLLADVGNRLPAEQQFRSHEAQALGPLSPREWDVFGTLDVGEEVQRLVVGGQGRPRE